MSFSALNQSEELVAQDAEEHTRELQIEEAFAVFQNALRLQKDADFAQSRIAYKALFAIDVISTETNASSPALRTLRYLAHRNRGLLYFEELRHKISTLSTNDMFSLLDNSVDDLIEALQHTDGDTVLVNLLLAIFRFFGDERLSRFIVEYALTKEENEDLMSHKSRRLQSRDLRAYAAEEIRILSKIKVIGTDQLFRKDSLELPDVTFLQPLKDFTDAQRQDRLEDRIENIKLVRVTMNDICLGLGSVTGKSKSKSQTLRDTYLELDDIIASVKFDISNSADKHPTSLPKEVPVQTSTSASEDETKRPAMDDLPQRASKRVRTQEDNDALFEETLQKSRRFIDTFNTLVSQFDVQLPEYEIKKADRTTLDFLTCLNSWSLKHTEHFLQSFSNSSSDVPLSELLNSVELNHEQHDAIDQGELWFEQCNEYVSFVNSNELSFPEVRMSFMKLALSQTGDNRCFIIESSLDPEAYSFIELFVFSSEKECLDQSSNTGDLSYMVSMFEVMVNFWLQSKQDSGSSVGNRTGIDTILLTWNKKLSTLLPRSSVLSFRHQWCFALYYRHCEGNDASSLRRILDQLVSEMSISNPEMVITYVNYESIPALSIQSIRNQCDKLEVLTVFDRTIQGGAPDSVGTMSLLENMLLCSTTDNTCLTSMEKFVKESPLGIKLRLWQILLNSYIETSQLGKYIRSMDVLLPFFHDSISNEAFSKMIESQRHRTILMVLGFYGVFIEGLTKMVLKERWCIGDSSARLFENLMKFLNILYCYCLYEHMGQSTRSPTLKPPTPSKSVGKLRDMIADTLLMIVLCFDQKVVGPRDQVLDLMSVIHEEIGLLHFCDAASGRFLELSEHLLESSDPEKFEVDILQHMNCRFHMSISTESFTPFSHETKSVEFTRDSAFQFSGFIFGVISRKKDPLISQLKPDLKNAMDLFYDAIGEPDEHSHAIQRNISVLERYLDQSIDMRLFRDAFWGSLSLELQRDGSNVSQIAEKGLYYFQGAASMNLYKSRKRLSQGKATDLEQVIKLLRMDLISGTGRTETWFLLGEAYSLQAEDDLVWTADRLNSIEKKFGVASTQRKSLLCYCMALSSYVRHPLEPTVGGLLCGAFARELYHSLMRPMEGFSFLGSLQRKVLTADGLSKVKSSMTSEKHVFLLKAVERLCRMAIAYDRESWINFYYLAKTLHKLGAPPGRVLNACLKACHLSGDAVEPHYQLCSLLLKYVKSSGYSVSKAISKFQNAVSVFGGLEIDATVDTLEATVLCALKKLVLIDKKKWHHRPKFRAAKVLYDIGEYRRAAEEMENFILLKSNNKTLVNIWKPEYETPGKHFVYTYDYIVFYIDIAWKLVDLQSLLLFTKKLRRFGSNMVDLPDAWEKACFALCMMAKQIAGVEKGYTDIEVPKLNYTEFTSRSQQLTNLLRKSIDPKDLSLLVLIHEIQELRRMNNGFGPTSHIDDTLNSLYLTFYSGKQKLLEEVGVEEVSQQRDGSPAVKVRVAKRDMLNAAANMVKAIEEQLKDHKVSDDVSFQVPEHLTQSRRRGSIVFATALDGTSSYQLVLPPVTPQIIDVQDESSNETEEEFHTPETNLAKASSVEFM